MNVLDAGDDLLPKILKSCLSILPLTSVRDVEPGEVMTVNVRSAFSEFPEKVVFAQVTSSCFEIDEVSLRGWSRTPRILQARDRGDRTDLASIGELFCRVIVPASIDVTLTVRNVCSVPQRFVGGIASHSSVVDCRESLLRNCSGCRPLAYARWWWSEDHQCLVDLSEGEVRMIEASLARCADGSPRRDLRVSLD